MLTSFEDFLNAQEEAFSECEDFVPRIERIKEADKIGREVLSFIDDNVNSANMEAFDDIDVNKIVNDLHLDINKDLDGDVLSSIYDEITDSFSQGGKVSLQDYLAQGLVALNDMLYELKGEVDYSIEYSERQLKEEEKKAFDRFNIVMSMKNLSETAFCFDISSDNASQAYLRKAESYLSVLGGEPYADTIEEKIAEINNCVLMVETLDKMGAKVKEKAALNDFFTEKVSNIVEDLSRYREDANIQSMFNSLRQTAVKYSDNEVIQNLRDNLEMIQEKVIEADLSKANETVKDNTVEKLIE